MKKFLVLLLLLTGCRSPHYAPNWPPKPREQPRVDLDSEFQCQKFVQEFYDWYVRQWNADGNEPNITYVRGLNLKPKNFSPELKTLLMKDALMHRKDRSLVTLEGDPFLSGQYYAGPYIIYNIMMEEGHCFASMYDGDDPSARVLVTSELEPVNNDWVFVNFHYPQHKNVKANDLLDILENLQDDRHTRMKTH